MKRWTPTATSIHRTVSTHQATSTMLNYQVASFCVRSSILLHRGLSKKKKAALERLSVLESAKRMTPKIKQEIELVKSTLKPQPRRVESHVVESLMSKMVAKGFTEREKKGLLTEAERAEKDLKEFTASKSVGDERRRKYLPLSHQTPIDHLSIEEIYDYLFVALKGGDVPLEARRRIPMSMRMACGERSMEVPPPSFLYILLQNDTSLLQEGYHARIAYAVEQWVKLTQAQRKYFVDHPLKGISE